MTERSVAVRLIAITNQYNDAMKASGQNTRQLGTEAETMGTKSDVAAKKVDNLGNSVQNADRKAKDAKPSFSALGISILALGPALVPVAGLAVAGAGALGGMGAAGILAFGGIKKEITAGTALGNTYAAQLLLLKNNLTTLQHTAASGVLAGFETAVADVQKQMPFLNASVATFSTLAGKSGANLEQGLVSSLHTLMPLFTEVGADVEGLTARFATWAAGGGFQKFSDWAQANLPGIEHDLGLITSAVGRLIDGFAPLGGIALGELGLVAKAINALPVSVLQTLIPLLVEGYLAFKAYQGLSSVGNSISGVAAKLRESAGASASQVMASKAAAASIVADDAAINAAARVQAATMAQTAAEYEAALATERADVALTAEAYIVASAEVVAAQEAEAVAMVAAADAAKASQLASRATTSGIGLIGGATLGVTAALTVGALAFNSYEKSEAAAAAQAKAFKDALVASKGAIDGNVLSMTAGQLQADGLADKAQKAGISLADLTTGVTGTDAQFAKLFETWRSSGAPSIETLASLLALRSEFVKGTISAKQYTDAVGKLAPTTAADAPAVAQNAAQIAALGAKYGATADEVQAFADKNKITLTGQAAQTVAFEKAADKAALAGTSIAKLTDDVRLMGSSLVDTDTKMADFIDALKQESTIAGGDSVRSQATLQSSLNSLADTLKAGKGAFDDYTDAGLASLSAVDASATAAAAYAGQVFKATGSVQSATDAYGHWYDALIATGKAQGISKKQIDDYLYSVGQLPSQVSDALTGTADAGAQAAQQMTDALTSGLAAGLQPMVNELDAILVALGGASIGPAYQSGAAVGSAFSAGIQAYISTGNPSGSVYNSQVPGQPNSVTKAYVAPVKASVPSFGGIHAGSLTPPSAGSSGGLTAVQKAVVAQDDLLAAQALSAIDPTNKLALAQAAVADATRRLNNETTKGTTAYYQGLVTLHQAQSALTAEVVSEQQARAAATAQLAKDVATENTLLAQEASTTTQFYADLSSAAATHAANDNALLAGRTTALESWANAANVATVSWGSSLTWLTSNVQDQVNQFNEWMTLLAQARANGVSSDVISALGLDQGPQALGQLQQFASATKDQIDALNAAVAAKNAAAGQETTVEAANNYGDLGKALVSEQQAYANAVLALQAKFVADMAAMALQVKQAQQAITSDQNTIAALPPQYKAVGTAGAGTWAPGSSLYTEDSAGNFTHIANVQALQALAKSTPIFEKLYDTGGMLAPGLTFAYNKTGRPEHILTGDQFNALVGGGGGTSVRVFLGTREITDLVTEVMSDRNAARKTAIAVAGSR